MKKPSRYVRKLMTAHGFKEPESWDYKKVAYVVFHPRDVLDELCELRRYKRTREEDQAWRVASLNFDWLGDHQMEFDA